MTRSTLSKLAVHATRQITTTTARRSSLLIPASIRGSSQAVSSVSTYHGQTGIRASTLFPRAFSTTRPAKKGLSPESEEPPIPISAQEPSAESIEYNVGGVPADITLEKYHELSDEYLNSLVEKIEQLQEETEDVDCDYDAGVLNIVNGNGTYVINKQPPNKQIWLSSPLSGPKRYDYVITSEGQDAKEGTGAGEWVYLRDGSTLTELLEREVGVDMSDLYAPVPHIGE